MDADPDLRPMSSVLPPERQFKGSRVP